MVRTNHLSLPPPPQPTRILFDPYNGTSTGHQTAPHRLSGSTSWRQSRAHKLSHQFRDATGGGGKTHLSDLVGAGSENWRKDGRKDNGDWEAGAPGLRKPGWQDIRELLGNTRKRSRDDAGNNGDVGGSSKEKERPQHHRVSSSSSKRRRLAGDSQSIRRTTPTIVNSDVNKSEEIDGQAVAALDDTPVSVAAGNNKQEHDDEEGRNENENRNDAETIAADHNDYDEDDKDDTSSKLPRQIFRGLNIYLNGSTAPLISDHKLKQLFTRHGGNTSIALGRRTVTHVILGMKCGGGLASSKIQKENATVRGKGIKYVTAQWVLDSIERGIRQPESRYAAEEVRERLGGARQESVGVLFRRGAAG